MARKKKQKLRTAGDLIEDAVEELNKETPAEGVEATAKVGDESAAKPASEAAACKPAAEPVAAESQPATPTVSSSPLSPLEEMIEIEAKMAIAEAEKEEHVAEVNARKAALKALSLRLRECVRRARTGATKDLFADKPAEQPTEQAAAGPDPEAWRSAPIASLDLPPSTVKALAEANLETVGALADYTSTGRILTDIRGIGKAAVDKISDASERFHARYAATHSATHTQPAAPSAPA